eukprot:5850897-Alexandrium_andersonii.AAC.1
MSASLVGSEMCIRDSLRGHRLLARCAHLEEDSGRQLPLFQIAGHGAMPVSYTHLTLPTICSV